MEGTDTTSGYAANPLFTNGAGHVSVNGAVTAVSGASALYTLNAEFAAGSGDAAGEFIYDATGWKGFTVDIIDDAVLAVDESLMICWSTATATDEAATTTELDSLRTDLTTPNGAAHTNCAIVTVNTKTMPVILWDGITTIKTISVATQSTANKNVVISVVS